MTKRIFNCGADLASTGCTAITENDKILDICYYPKLKYTDIQKQRVREINKIIEEINGLPRTQTKIKTLKAEKKAIQQNGVRDFNQLYNFFDRYKDCVEYVVLEQPIETTGGMTTSRTTSLTWEIAGTYKVILGLLDIEQVWVRPQDWHKMFDYSLPKGLSYTERKQLLKTRSIRLAKEYFSNMQDYIFRTSRCTTEDDNVCEAVLISKYKI